jgi:hypothetical protein
MRDREHDAKTTEAVRIRLAAAGCLNLVLLVWVALDPWENVLKYVAGRQAFANPSGILLTAAISLVILTLLFPVLLRGRDVDRLLTTLFAPFPLFMFAVAVSWAF